MTVQNTKENLKVKKNSNSKNKKKINNKGKKKSVRKILKGQRIRIKKIDPRLLIFIIFFTGILLIVSSYAWLSASLNVKVKFLDMSVSSNSGLFISLDGIDFSDSVEISLDSVISDLKERYPSNTNQWASAGLWPVSTIGIPNSNSDKFDVYVGEIVKNKKKIVPGERLLNTTLVDQNNSSAANVYIAFDIFLKNVSGSPLSDNLYFDDDTAIDFDYNKYADTDEATKEDIIDSMSGIMNSMRIGLIKVGSVPLKSSVNNIQNIVCNNNCEMVIYEPNSTAHSEGSIKTAKESDITLVDGTYNPTYAIINEGRNLQHSNGQEDTGIPLDTEHFALQKTTTTFTNPIFQIPSGITKVRAYVWIEGQDIDSLETYSKGAAITIAINFIKDLSGYN